MLDTIRFRIGATPMGKAADLIETGEFKNIKRGLNLVKLSVYVTPPSKEITDFGRKLSDLVEKYSEKKEEL